MTLVTEEQVGYLYRGINVVISMQMKSKPFNMFCRT